MQLTPRQQRFVDEYLIDLNATQAAIRAGYEWPTGHAGFYVYFLIDPRDHAIFYVGKGKGERMSWHTRQAISGNAGNGVKTSRILAILASGMQPVERVFVHGMEESAAFSVERILIQNLRDGITNIVGGCVSREESELSDLENFLDRVKPFDRWFMEATDAQLRSARRLCGTAAAFYGKVVGELLDSRDALASIVAVNTEISGAENAF